MKTKQNASADRMTETTVTSERSLIPWVVAGGVGLR
jgi:hypothetical protein